MTSLLAHVNDLNQSGQGQEFGWRMMGSSDMMGWWPMMGSGWLGGIFSLVIGGLVILVLVALFRLLWQKGTEKKGAK